MSSESTAESLSEMLTFFKALSDKSRLKILGTVSIAERSVEELASLLELQGPTISHHLVRMLQGKRLAGRPL